MVVYSRANSCTYNVCPYVVYWMNNCKFNEISPQGLEGIWNTSGPRWVLELLVLKLSGKCSFLRNCSPVSCGSTLCICRLLFSEDSRAPCTYFWRSTLCRSLLSGTLSSKFSPVFVFPNSGPCLFKSVKILHSD